MIRYHVNMDKAGVYLLVYHIIVYTLWIYITTLCVNLLAIKVGSNTSFTVVVTLQTVFVVSISIINNMKTGFWGTFCFKLNPICHLILGWQSSKVGELNKILNPPFKMLSMNRSLLYMTCLFIVVTLIGAFMIKKHDLLSNDVELGV